MSLQRIRLDSVHCNRHACMHAYIHQNTHWVPVTPLGATVTVAASRALRVRLCTAPWRHMHGYPMAALDLQLRSTQQYTIAVPIHPP